MAKKIPENKLWKIVKEGLEKKEYKYICSNPESSWKKLREGFLCMVINGVKPTQDLSFARYRNYPIYDTMKEWVRWSSNSLSLEHLALAMGIPTPKDEIDGSQVYEFYKKGRIQEILDYCKKDIETTRAVYKKMTFS
jgi:predicted RecB family nuclease